VGANSEFGQQRRAAGAPLPARLSGESKDRQCGTTLFWITGTKSEWPINAAIACLDSSASISCPMKFLMAG
jgi:hypothetical protein